MTNAAFLNSQATADVLAALAFIPEETWDTWDDKCDCVFPRIGMWTNPYTAETLEVRMCCIWQHLYQLFPEQVRLIPAFYDHNQEEWVPTPQEWNGEFDMPAYLWYRQRARIEGTTVAEARAKYGDQSPPKGVLRAVVDEQPQEEPYNPLEMLFEMVTGLAEKVAGLLEAQDRLDAERLAGVRPGSHPDSDGAGTGHSGAVPAGDGAVAPKRTRRPRVVGVRGDLP